MDTKLIRLIHCLLTALVLIAHFIVTGWDNLFAVVFLFLLTMSPLVINVIAAIFVKHRVSQIVLLCTTLLYTAWAAFLYIDVTYINNGAQAGFTLLLTAIAASPALIIAWVACLVIEIVNRTKRRQDHEAMDTTC